MFVAVQPVGVAVDAAVFIAEDGVFFAVAVDAEGGRYGGVEACFKHFCSAQPCRDLAVAVHRVFRFALLPV